MNVSVNKKTIVTGVSVTLSSSTEIRAFSSLLELARRQIEPMYTESRQSNGPYVRDLAFNDFHAARNMMHELFDCLPEESEEDLVNA